MESARTVIILAAGEGKRMKSALPKVLHPLLGRTLLGHVLTAAEGVAATRTIVVVGHGADRVAEHLATVAPHAATVLQAEQHGTGHAARVALEAEGPVRGLVVIVNGDLPLLRPETLAGLVAVHESAGAAATLLTADVPNPTGAGRIIRHSADGAVSAIVEERDATAAQRAITEINAGVYAFDAVLLAEALAKLTTDNEQGEEYLTDVVGLLVNAGRKVVAHPADDPIEVLGCNDRVELALLRARLRDRVNADWMRAGVSIQDPATTWIDVTVTLARDVVVDQNTQLYGGTTVAQGAVVGPDTTVIDSSVGEGATVLRAHLVQAEVGPQASVGPYAYLRPGSRLRRKAHVGTFVETKNAEVGEGAKVPHLTYAGDATIGARANIGAGTIFVNYDGVNKHHSTVGPGAFVGSHSSLIAPVEVGPGAFVGAGSVVYQDVPAGALGVTRAEQRNNDGWVLRRRPGTVAAAAAQASAGAEAADQAGGSRPAERGVTGAAAAGPEVGAETPHG